MAIYYVGKGGNDSNNGSTWALRKLTIDAAVSLATTAGDIVRVGAGVYRETVTLDASGSSGNLITLFGDIWGEFTDGIGGEIVITGSDDDIDGDRTNVIAGASRNYWAFWNITFEAGTGTVVESLGTNCEMYNCRVDGADSASRRYGAAFGANAFVVASEFMNGDGSGLGVGTGSRVERCVFESCVWGLETSGNTVKVYNCQARFCTIAFVFFSSGLTGSQRNEVFSCSGDAASGTFVFSSGADGSVLADGNVMSPGLSNNGVTPTNNITNGRRCTKRGSMFRELSGRGPLIAGVGTHSTETDPFGTEDGYGQNDIGPVRYYPLAAFGSTGGVASDPTWHEWEVPVVDGSPLTVSCDVEWSGAITSKPYLELQPRYGISLATDTATGSGSSEPLSVSSGGNITVPGGGNGIMKVRVHIPEVGTTVTVSGLGAAHA